MRAALTLCSFLISAPVLAANFELSSDVSAVTAYASGGLITRDIALDVPAGSHQVTLTLPRSVADYGQFRFAIPPNSGLSLVSSVFKVDRQVPERPKDSPELKTAKDGLRAAESALRAFELEQADMWAQQRGAQARLEYLTSVSQGKVALFHEGEPNLSAEQFGARVAELGAQAATAQSDLVQANAALAAGAARSQELQDDVDHAAQKVAALTPQDTQSVQLVLNVIADAPFSGSVLMTHRASGVNWTPQYELDLAQDGDAGALTIVRRASVFQATGEDWTNVKLTLSTAAIGGQMQTQLPREWVQVLANPQLRGKVSAEVSLSRAPSVIADEAVVLEDAGQVAPQVKGQTIEFVLNTPQTLRSDRGGGRAELDIDRIEMDIDLFAKAHAAQDNKGFLYADLLNETGGNLLQGAAFVYRDGAFMGQLTFPAITNGDRADVSFGPLDGLLVERRTISREDGDRGIITSSNQRTIRMETTVTSLLDYPIALQLFDQVPVSESEDLKITEVISPRPSETAVEGRRGVMRWDFDMTPGAIKTLRIGYDTVWPEGQSIVRRRGR